MHILQYRMAANWPFRSHALFLVEFLPPRQRECSARDSEMQAGNWRNSSWRWRDVQASVVLQNCAYYLLAGLTNKLAPIILLLGMREQKCCSRSFAERWRRLLLVCIPITTPTIVWPTHNCLWADFFIWFMPKINWSRRWSIRKHHRPGGSRWRLDETMRKDIWLYST